MHSAQGPPCIWLMLYFCCAESWRCAGRRVQPEVQGPGCHVGCRTQPWTSPPLLSVTAPAQQGRSSLLCQPRWLVPRLRGDSKAEMTWKRLGTLPLCQWPVCMGRSGQNAEWSRDVGLCTWLSFPPFRFLSIQLRCCYLYQKVKPCEHFKQLQMEAFIMLTPKMVPWQRPTLEPVGTPESEVRQGGSPQAGQRGRAPDY